MTPSSRSPGRPKNDLVPTEGGPGAQSSEAPLAGLGVLVTRPREQAASLAQRLEQLGARPILFPALAILPPRDTAPLQELLTRLDRFDLAIFISPTAAQRGMVAVKARRSWPAGLAVAAIGQGTAQVLGALGFTQILEPEDGADSEHLLALPRMQQVSGRHIVIFRGEGGRETLAEALRARGAQVAYAECYRRGLPEMANTSSILESFRSGDIQAVTAYSSETLDNLWQLLGDAGRPFLMKTPLFVPHPRIASHAKALGVLTAIAPLPPGAELTASLVEYFTHD